MKSFLLPPGLKKTANLSDVPDKDLARITLDAGSATDTATALANANAALDAVADRYTKAESDGRFINTTGDTMSGMLRLFGSPVDALDAATKAYADTRPGPVGPQGPAGPPGTAEGGMTIWTGVVPPTLDIGNVGDYYIDSAADLMYGPKAADAWPLVLEAGKPGPVGPPGPTGETGPTGSQGPQGVPGLKGDPGTDGVDGVDGEDGAQGPIGPTGAAGPQGVPGTPGIPGADGADGVDGAQGPPGETGPAGATGPAGPQGIEGAPGAPGADGADGAEGPVGPEGPAGPSGSDADAGTLILDGAGPPGSVGTGGEYYVDTLGLDLYGPRQVGATAYRSKSYTTSSIPTHTSPSSLRTGSVFRFLAAGRIIGARFWRASDVVAERPTQGFVPRPSPRQTSHSVAIMSSNGQTTIAESLPTTGEPTSGSGWVEAMLATPLAVSMGDELFFGVDDNTAHNYSLAPPSLHDPNIIAFLGSMYGPYGGPVSNFDSGICYYVDPIWEVMGGGVWPLAVPGFPEAPDDGRLYARRGADASWQLAGDGSGGGGATGSAVVIADTPPSGALDGDLWWESDTGTLFVAYDDGTSIQWVATAFPPVDGSGSITQADADLRYVNVAGDAMAGSLRVGTSAPVIPGDVADTFLTAKRMILPMTDGSVYWNGYLGNPGPFWKYLETGISATMFLSSPTGVRLSISTSGTAGATIPGAGAKNFNFNANGSFDLPGPVTVNNSITGTEFLTQKTGNAVHGLIYLGNQTGGSRQLLYDGAYRMPGAATVVHSLIADSGNITASAGDLITHRASNAATGLVYFGNQSQGNRYLYYDGTNYNLPGAPLVVESLASNAGIGLNTGDVMVAAGAVHVRSAGAPHQGTIYLGNSGLRYLHFDGSDYYMPGSRLIVPGLAITEGALDVNAGDITVKRAGNAGDGLIFFGNSGNRYLWYNGSTFSFVNGRVTTIGIDIANTGWGMNYAAYDWSGVHYGNHYITGNLNGASAAFEAYHQPGVEAFARISCNTATFNFHNTGNATAAGTWIDGSDERNKTHFEAISDPISIVRGLKAYSYYRTNSEWLDKSPPREVGLVAQDVQAVLPEAVTHSGPPPDTDPEGARSLGVHTGAVVAIYADVLNAILDRLETVEARLASMTGSST